MADVDHELSAIRFVVVRDNLKNEKKKNWQKQNCSEKKYTKRKVFFSSQIICSKTLNRQTAQFVSLSILPIRNSVSGRLNLINSNWSDDFFFVVE